MENLENRWEKIQDYVEKKKKKLLIILSAIIIITAGSYWFFIYSPNKKSDEAVDRIHMAQLYFEKDSFAIALNGDGQNLGFKSISQQYPKTASGNWSNYYAGVCQLNLEKYAESINSFNKFQTEDSLFLCFKNVLIGDANAELKNYDKALDSYKKAMLFTKNDNFNKPRILNKKATIYYNKKNYKKALEIYKDIQKNYPQSIEAKDLEVNIPRTEQKINL